MAIRRALGRGPPMHQILTTDSLTFGRQQSRSKEIDSTANITDKVLTARRTYLTGVSGSLVGLTLTFPTASAAIDGMILTVMSTSVRGLVNWSTPGGASIVSGLLAGLAANDPVSFQYHAAANIWFKI